jgi:hypothetical protein
VWWRTLPLTPHLLHICFGGDVVESGPVGTAEYLTEDSIDFAHNADGLIVISDMTVEFWTFRMGGFNGWSRKDSGMLNISNVQNWDTEAQPGATQDGTQ